jgi:hypothetical protein
VLGPDPVRWQGNRVLGTRRGTSGASAAKLCLFFTGTKFEPVIFLGDQRLDSGQSLSRLMDGPNLRAAEVGVRLGPSYSRRKVKTESILAQQPTTHYLRLSQDFVTNRLYGSNVTLLDSDVMSQSATACVIFSPFLARVII